MFINYSIKNISPIIGDENIRIRNISIIDSEFIDSTSSYIIKFWGRTSCEDVKLISESIVKVYSEKNIDVVYNLYLFAVLFIKTFIKRKVTKHTIRELFYSWDKFSKYENDIYKCHAKYNRMKAFL